MPRQVRNFWLDIYLDGRKTRVKTGPRGKHGGFLAEIFIRDGGKVTKAGTLFGTEENGRLEIVWGSGPKSIVETKLYACMR